MRKSAVKGVLVSILGISAVSSNAKALEGKDELQLLEELTPEVRVVVYREVIEMLKLSPKILDSSSVLAMDSKGTIYVLDKTKPQVILGRVGEPSCVSRTNGR